MTQLATQPAQDDLRDRIRTRRALQEAGGTVSGPQIQPAPDLRARIAARRAARETPPQEIAQPASLMERIQQRRAIGTTEQPTAPPAPQAKAEPETIEAEGVRFYKHGPDWVSAKTVTMDTDKGAINFPTVLPGGKIAEPREAMNYWQTKDPLKIEQFRTREEAVGAAQRKHEEHQAILQRAQTAAPAGGEPAQPASLMERIQQRRAMRTTEQPAAPTTQRLAGRLPAEDEDAEGIQAELQQTGPTFRAEWAGIVKSRQQEREAFRAAPPAERTLLERGVPVTPENLALVRQGKVPPRPVKTEAELFPQVPTFGQWAYVAERAWLRAGDEEKQQIARAFLQYERDGQLDLPTERGPRPARENELKMLQEVQGLSAAERVHVERLARVYRVERTGTGVAREMGESLLYLGSRAINPFNLGDRFIPGLGDWAKHYVESQPSGEERVLAQATGEITKFGTEMKAIGALFRAVAWASPLAAEALAKMPGLRRVGPAVSKALRLAEFQERFPATAKLTANVLKQVAVSQPVAAAVTGLEAVGYNMSWEEAEKQWGKNAAFFGLVSAAYGAMPFAFSDVRQSARMEVWGKAMMKEAQAVHAGKGDIEHMSDLLKRSLKEMARGQPDLETKVAQVAAVIDKDLSAARGMAKEGGIPVTDAWRIVKAARVRAAGPPPPPEGTPEWWAWARAQAGAAKPATPSAPPAPAAAAPPVAKAAPVPAPTAPPAVPVTPVQPTPPAAAERAPIAHERALEANIPPAAAEVAPPKTRADIQRDLALWRQYQETGDESLLEDMTPGTVVDVSKEVATMSLDLAAGLKTIGERRAFWNRIEQAAELVESGEATKGELGAELAAYQAIWGKTDPLHSTLLERLGFPELITEPAAAEAVPAPGAVVPEVGIAPPAAKPAPAVGAEGEVAPEAPTLPQAEKEGPGIGGEGVRPLEGTLGAFPEAPEGKESPVSAPLAPTGAEQGVTEADIAAARKAVQKLPRAKRTAAGVRRAVEAVAKARKVDADALYAAVLGEAGVPSVAERAGRADALLRKGEAVPAREAPPAEPATKTEKPSPVEERLDRWLRTQSGGQLARTARTMGIVRRPDVAAALVQRGRAVKHLRDVRAKINEKAIDADLDRYDLGDVPTPLLDWLRGDKINAWRGLQYATEIAEAVEGRPELAKLFLRKQPTGVRPAQGYIDQRVESATRDAESGFRGETISDFLDQLTREADLSVTSNVRNLPLPQKLERLARAAHAAGEEEAASGYESQARLCSEAAGWEMETTDALRESVGRYIESKAKGAGLAWATATPAAREAAEQLGVRLDEVTPTGKEGAILEQDVRRAAVMRDKGVTAGVRHLRQVIRAVVAERGLPESEWRDIARDVSGHRRLTATHVTEEHLEEILRRIKAARPRQVRRGTGFVQVIRPKTEGKIQTLRERLGTIGQMTDADFGRILADMGIQEPRYVSAQKFITESQGHEILRAMLDAAPEIGRRTARDSALDFPHEGAPKNLREAWERVDREIKAKAEKATAKPYPAKVSTWLDMRYYAQRWEERTGAPMSEAVQEVLDARAGIEREVETGIHDRIAQAIGEDELERLTADPAACARIEAYLASELKRGGPEKPAGITPTEVKAAEVIQEILRDYETPARVARFYDSWEADAKIPDATPEQLREATDILETQGHEALERHLATQTWGIIESGYTPLSVVKTKAKVRTYRLPPTAMGKGHLQSRGGLYMEQERTIFQRLNSYAYQILGLARLRRPIRSFVRVFDQASGRMKNPQKVAAIFSTWLDEVKGYPARYHPVSAFIRRAYAQAMTAIVLIDPRKWVRNLFQNLAFYPDRTDFLNPHNKTLSTEDREYFREHVSQRFGMLQHYFMSAEKPFWGFRHITEWARKISRYPWTDETNRWGCYWAKINRVRRAVAAHPKDAEAMQKAANMMDLELVQRREALRVLAADGPDAMARYVAGQVTYNVHFAYDRAMRAPIEMGDIGRILMNLATFPRSYGQQLVLSAKQITHGKTPAVRLRGFKKFINLILGAMTAGWLYQYMTGDRNNPYNPLNVLRWNLGGLSVGAAQEGFETMGDIPQAILGDKQALARLDTAIPRCADLFVPFYRGLINAAEGLTGYKNLDRLALRKIRALTNERYGGPVMERYKVMRNAIETMQKILFGSEPPEPEKPPKTGGPRAPAAPTRPQRPRPA